MKIQGKKSLRAWGMVCGIVAAVCYGTNPLGALKLYAEGMSTGSVLFYRFGLAWIIMSVVLLFRHETLKVSLHELKVLLGLGLLFTISSLTLYLSFRVMDAGVASTILFTYPVMTAVIMALFFHERLNWVTGVSIALSFLGVALLYRGDGQVVLPWVGVVLVLLSEEPVTLKANSNTPSPSGSVTVLLAVISEAARSTGSPAACGCVTAVHNGAWR